jgi:hypothetical protein
MLMRKGHRPEDKEECVRLKQVNKHSVLPFNSWLAHQKISTVLVQSVIRRLPNLCFQWGGIHGRTNGHKWSLLKVREEKYKGKHDGTQVEDRSQERVFVLFRFF